MRREFLNETSFTLLGRLMLGYTRRDFHYLVITTTMGMKCSDGAEFSYDVAVSVIYIFWRARLTVAWGQVAIVECREATVKKVV